MAHGDLSHLEIPADDPERAKRFYEGLMGWSFSEMEGFPDYFLFSTRADVDGSATSGGAIGRRGVNSRERTLQYAEVDSIDAALEKATQLGGSVVSPKEQVGEAGWSAVVVDTEGNELGLWEEAPSR